MRVGRILAAGAVGGVAVAMLNFKEGDLAFQIGFLIGAAFAGMALAYLVARLARWTA